MNPQDKTPVKGKKNSGRRGRKGSSRRNQSHKPQIETIELNQKEGGYIYAYMTRAGKQDETSVFTAGQAKKRLIGLKSEYFIPSNLLTAMFKLAAKLRTDLTIDTGVELKLSSVAQNNEIVQVNGKRMFLVDASQLKNGGEIVFGDTTLLVVDPAMGVDNATAAPPKKVTKPTGNGETKSADAPTNP